MIMNGTVAILCKPEQTLEGACIEQQTCLGGEYRPGSIRHVCPGVPIKSGLVLIPFTLPACQGAGRKQQQQQQQQFESSEWPQAFATPLLAMQHRRSTYTRHL
ncbi:hypothetical protein CVIRNUC_006923 [Coccomyxa viridis]|uniref:Uncharacterized protein n=1 Tax=Coccomyxa viridis TaxID=1274662 RepID=A0AAV1ICN4_9CHLO|nr:hypothetical protein CVIRNUC_006923 [Coccomyxa viridis]